MIVDIVALNFRIGELALYELTLLRSSNNRSLRKYGLITNCHTVRFKWIIYNEMIRKKKENLLLFCLFYRRAGVLGPLYCTSRKDVLFCVFVVCCCRRQNSQSIYEFVSTHTYGYRIPDGKRV